VRERRERKQRATLYIDGFNFYYGVTQFWREKNEEWAGLGWCDFRALVERPSALAKNDPFLLS